MAQHSLKNTTRQLRLSLIYKPTRHTTTQVLANVKLCVVVIVMDEMVTHITVQSILLSKHDTLAGVCNVHLIGLHRVKFRPLEARFLISSASSGRVLHFSCSSLGRGRSVFRHL